MPEIPREIFFNSTCDMGTAPLEIVKPESEDADGPENGWKSEMLKSCGFLVYASVVGLSRPPAAVEHEIISALAEATTRGGQLDRTILCGESCSCLRHG